MTASSNWIYRLSHAIFVERRLRWNTGTPRYYILRYNQIYTITYHPSHDPLTSPSSGLFSFFNNCLSNPFNSSTSPLNFLTSDVAISTSTSGLLSSTFFPHPSDSKSQSSWHLSCSH